MADSGKTDNITNCATAGNKNGTRKKESVIPNLRLITIPGFSGNDEQQEAAETDRTNVNGMASHDSRTSEI
jgi:hypothetical protein